MSLKDPMFEPIAIIGEGCVLPGALNSQALWQRVTNREDCLSFATESEWRLPPESILLAPNEKRDDCVASLRKGSIPTTFKTKFDAEGFALSSNEIIQYDASCHWLLQASRDALSSAGYDIPLLKKLKAGAVIGNLSYPTSSLNRYAESVWLSQLEQPHAINRFMSGMPSHLLAQACHLMAGAMCIDAACASALYAIKLACDRLHDGKADLMLAGGVNGADSLFTQIGFTVLQALSPSGQSRPFHQQADGLVPAQGAAVVLLKRLKDAIAAKDTILGVIRGIGLSNDGKQGGLLTPAEKGQVGAMRQAYAMSQLKPEDVSWIECHATGTSIGDVTELRSMQQIFPANKKYALGALKANIGHSITASGTAALINVLSAFKAGQKPPSLSAQDHSIEALRYSPFYLPQEMESWEGYRCAAINCFGFGGNNAHLLVEAFEAKTSYTSVPAQKLSGDIAIVSVGLLAGKATTREEFVRAIYQGESQLSEYLPDTLGGLIENIDLDLAETHFPPNVLHQTLGQQLAILKASQQALSTVSNINGERTAILIGMQCDAEVARRSLRWRLDSLFPMSDPAWLREARDQICPAEEVGHVLGCMPNVVANRLNHQFNFTAPSFSVSAEELSGIAALKIAVRDLQAKSIDAALVGAVDLCCEAVHHHAAKQIFSESASQAGDAAVVLVLKRLEDALAQGDIVYAIIPGSPQETTALSWDEQANYVTSLFGHAHAASGLMRVASAALACHEKLIPVPHNMGVPWAYPRTTKIVVQALGDQQDAIYISEQSARVTRSKLKKSTARIYVYSGSDKMAILKALDKNERNGSGKAKLTFVAHDEEEFHQQVQIAKQRLLDNESLPNGMYYCEQPLMGEIAFVFPGAMTSYAKMGHELFLQFPELVDTIAEQVPSLQKIIDALYDTKRKWTIFEDLQIYSLLCQMHAILSQNILKIKPQACIGLSSGETNGLIAFKVWRDLEKLFQDIDDSKMYTDTLSGDFSVLTAVPSPHQEKWQSWRVFADVEQIRMTVEKIPSVHVTIVNSAQDCIVSGTPDACQTVLAAFNEVQAQRLPYTMVVHCPELQAAKEMWRQVHTRETYPSEVRFYSTATGQSYVLNSENAAEALLAQALNPIDFRRVVKKAWEDGVRIFIEHGPRGLCSQWINDTLRDKPHLAVALDVFSMDPVTQIAYATAQLIAAGVSCDYSIFS